MLKNKTVTMDNLAVVDFYEDHSTPEIRKWKSRRLGNHIVAAESCSRQILYGHGAYFDDFPETDPVGKAKILRGPEAYAFLLQYMLGLVNPDGLDAPAERRFFINWGNMNRRHSASAEHLAGIVQCLTSDSLKIKTNIMTGIKAERQWLIARDLSGQKKNDSVLIIGDVESVDDNTSKLTPLTLKIATTMNGSGVCKARDIAYTNPSSSVVSSIASGFNKLKIEGKLRTDFYGADFYGDLPLLMEMADRVYITMDMGQDPEADQFIIDCWNGRQRKDNVLVHMKVAPGSRGISSGVWANAGLDNYISPEDIRNEGSARSASYKEITSAARQATHDAAQGLLPSNDHHRSRHDRVRRLQAA